MDRWKGWRREANSLLRVVLRPEMSFGSDLSGNPANPASGSLISSRGILPETDWFAGAGRMTGGLPPAAKS